MTETEVEQLVLDSVRRYTAKDSVGLGSRFEADLRLSEAARGMLFASLAQAFSARGVSLPSHGFLQRDFLACPTPADVRDAIRQKVFGAAAPAKPAAAKTAPPRKKATPKPAAKSRPAKARAAVKKRRPSGK